MSLVSLFRMLVLITLIGLSIAVYTGVKINQLQDNQQVLAEQRQSTVDRLRLVRAEIQAARQLVAKYVVNDDARALVTYYELLDMHAGNRVYGAPVSSDAWGDLLAGNAVHNIQLIEGKGPTIDQRLQVDIPGAELAPETISQYTQALFEKEQIIFALTQGLYDPQANAFASDAQRRPDLALQRLYSPAYQQLVNDASSVIDRQINRTDKGFQNELQTLSNQITRFAKLSLYALLFLATLLIGGLLALLRFIVGPIRELDTLSREVEAGRYDVPLPKAYFVTEMVNLVHGIRLMLGSFTRELLVREEKLEAERQAIDAKLAREKAEADAAARGALLANMSHEIRTPMNAIIGMTNLVLRSDELTGKARGQLEKSLSAARSLLGLLNDILDFSKAESGMVELESVPFRLDDVLSHAYLAVQTEADKKQLLLLNRLSGENAYALSQHLVGDPLRFRQILTNLLSNAVKFTEQGQVNCHVKVTAVSENQAELVIEVGDSGIGMTAEQSQRIFDKYRQASASTSRHHGGTGLGLSITKELVTLMGGSIHITSAPGEGTVFRIEMPMELETQQIKLSVGSKPIFDRCLIIGRHTSVEYALQSSLKAAGADTEFTSDDLATERLTTAEMDLEAVLITQPERLLSNTQLCDALHTWADDYLGKIIVVLHTSEKFHSAAEVKAFSDLLPEDTTFLSNPILLDDLAKLGKEVPHQAGPSPTNYLEKAQAKLTGRRVLVLEDHPVNQALITEQLQSVGMLVTMASDGLIGLEKIKETDHGFDLVITDLEMPNLDGFGFTEAAKTLPHLNDLPIVGLTGHAFTEIIQRCYQVGMDHVLTKPLEEADLYDLLIKLVCNKPAQTTLKEVPSKPSLSKEHLVEIFLKHCGDTPEHLRSLMQLEAKSDFARELHSLVGALAVIGENQLSGSFRIFEKGLKANDLTMPAILKEVEAIWPELLSRLTMVECATPRR